MYNWHFYAGLMILMLIYFAFSPKLFLKIGLWRIKRKISRYEKLANCAEDYDKIREWRAWINDFEKKAKISG
jgi:hypothetical protein